MDQGDTCDIGLGLGLNIYDPRKNSEVNPTITDDKKDGHQRFDMNNIKLLERSSSNVVSHEASLTLDLLSDERHDHHHVMKGSGSNKACCSSVGLLGQSSPPHSSTISSFTDDPQLSLVIKMEGDGVSIDHDHQEALEGIASLFGADDYDDDGNTRKKLRLTKEQSALLEHKFKEHATLNPKQKQALAKQLKLRPRQVEVWFQNRRARTKLKQTQVDFEFLRKCYDALIDENRKLQKELQELKALKYSAALNNKQPSPALAICPSCHERRTTATVDSSRGSLVTTKPLLFNTFTHSTAC